ncbi:MAG: ABC transporter permease [candidate division Zixibacteria bacterium]|jgi:putative ABC transport system permease protein|nr:ABC transporter permease [candidate division Zixibacteria bacterium]
MVFLSLLTESVAALWANRLRSGLTILGMVMGVTSVIAIVSTVEGMQKSIEDVFASMGTNAFMVTRFGFNLTMEEYLERRRRKPLTRGLVDVIEDGCPDCRHIGAQGFAGADVKFGSRRLTGVEIQGQTPAIMDIQNIDVAMGRYLTEEDDVRRQRFAFIGAEIYEKLFDETGDPVGERIRVNAEEFTVIGVAEKLGNSDMIDGIDNFVAIPLSTHQKLFRQPGDPVMLYMDAASAEERERAMDQVRVVLRSARRLTYDDKDDFEVVTPEAILTFVNDVTRAFRVLLVSLPLLSIVVGGIVIMNIMMISVTERTREIGIRKSLGATRRHIMTQFLYESLALSLVGGLMGIAFGVKLGQVILRDLMGILMTPTTLGIILGFGISTGVGLFFGIYPALKAARLDPIKALSYE